MYIYIYVLYTHKYILNAAKCIIISKFPRSAVPTVKFVSCLHHYPHTYLQTHTRTHVHKLK